MYITDNRVEMSPLEAIEFAEKLLSSARAVLAHNERNKTGAGYDYQTLVGNNGDVVRTIRIRVGNV